LLRHLPGHLLRPGPPSLAYHLRHHRRPVLRGVDRHGRLGRPLSAQGVAIVVKRHVGALGYPQGDFAGHSLRRGHATTAARNGATERTIMRTTGHTNTATVRGYIDDAELFTDPASAYLGL
jgi:integrase